ncbi:hypothetical protein DMENIID0001_169920 [Sergentomyia squamirostris]
MSDIDEKVILCEEDSDCPEEDDITPDCVGFMNSNRGLSVNTAIIGLSPISEPSGELLQTVHDTPSPEPGTGEQISQGKSSQFSFSLHFLVETLVPGVKLTIFLRPGLSQPIQGQKKHHLETLDPLSPCVERRALFFADTRSQFEVPQSRC